MALVVRVVLATTTTMIISPCVIVVFTLVFRSDAGPRSQVSYTHDLREGPRRKVSLGEGVLSGAREHAQAGRCLGSDRSRNMTGGKAYPLAQSHALGGVFLPVSGVDTSAPWYKQLSILYSGVNAFTRHPSTCMTKSTSWMCT